jgi:hypothetical protein
LKKLRNQDLRQLSLPRKRKTRKRIKRRTRRRIKKRPRKKRRRFLLKLLQVRSPSPLMKLIQLRKA